MFAPSIQNIAVYSQDDRRQTAERRDRNYGRHTCSFSGYGEYAGHWSGGRQAEVGVREGAEEMAEVWCLSCDDPIL